MIVAMELHIETRKTIGDMIDYFKQKGVASDFKMCKDSEHGMFQVKNPSKPEIVNFKIKLTEELGDTKRYEIMSWCEEDFNLSKEWFGNI